MNDKDKRIFTENEAEILFKDVSLFITNFGIELQELQRANEIYKVNNSSNSTGSNCSFTISSYQHRYEVIMSIIEVSFYA